jgi:hypothetical protein
MSICASGTITLTYGADDGCTSDEVSATFSWTQGAQVDVSGPADDESAACYYADDTALQAAYTAWVADFETLENGCGDDGAFTGDVPAADMSICASGTITLTYGADDGCTSDEVSATFSWTQGAQVDVAGPDNVSTGECFYANDAALQLAYTNWLAQFTTLENGCGDDGAFTTTPPSATSLSILSLVNISLTYSADDGCTDDSVTATFTAEPCLGDEGCTLGYWKEHTDRWCDSYTTCMLYEDVFADAPQEFKDADLTLLEALNLGGGGIYNLARQSVAALLNICSGEVSYNYSGGESQLITDVNNAYLGIGDFDAGAKAYQLDVLNNAGCPLGGTNATEAPSPACVTPTSAITTESANITLKSSSKAEQFSAYPVPFKETLNIQYKFDYTSDVTIQIFDMRGQLMKTAKEANASKDKVTTLSTDFARGSQVYIVQVKTDRETFIKQIVSDK